MNKYQKVLLKSYNNKYSTEHFSISNKPFEIYSTENSFIVNGSSVINQSHVSPDVPKPLVKAYNEMFLFNTPVRIVTDSGTGPYVDYKLGKLHNKDFWPNVLEDVPDFSTSEHKCACPNYQAFLLWFGNAHKYFMGGNFFVEFYSNSIERVCGTDGKQIGISVNARPNFKMPYKKFINRFVKNVG